MDSDSEVEFDPVLCAELHNQLLAKALLHIPNAIQEIKQDVISAWLELPPNEDRTDIRDSPLYLFLSLIHRYKPAEFLLTPEYEQPKPEWFDNVTVPGDPDDEDRRIILLYPEEDVSCGDWGLWFNLDTCLVIWGGWRGSFWPGCKVFPDDNHWVSLEFVLKKALRMWDIGKFYWGPGYGNPQRNTILMRSWMPTDLEKAIEQWEQLLGAIQERMPGSLRLPLQDPLPLDLLERYHINSFTKAFLSVAKRPSFTYVGPGITTFNPKSFADIYGIEPVDSYRLKKGNTDMGYERASLLLPAASGPISQQRPEPGAMLGNESATRYYTMVSQWPGLYIDSAVPSMHGDCATVVTDEGAWDVVRWDTPRPWGRNTGNLQLADMLDIWTSLVNEGIWTVNAQGVSTENRWFWDPATEDHRRAIWEKESY